MTLSTFRFLFQSLKKKTASYIFYFILFFKICLLIWQHKILVAAHGLFIAVCGGFFLVATLTLSCPMAYEILVPRPGMEPLSPALEGGVLTTELLGTSPHILSTSTFIALPVSRLLFLGPYECLFIYTPYTISPGKVLLLFPLYR